MLQMVPVPICRIEQIDCVVNFHELNIDKGLHR